MPIEYYDVSKCLKRDNFCGSMFGNMYTFSPYMGCTHNCYYCDGRAEKYHFEGNFAKDIKVRENIVDLLDSELPKLRENAPIHLASGISDIYQHIEKKLYLTGQCSEILKEHNFHVSVLTKSSLVLRDIDNWNQVNKRGGFTLQMTVNTLNDKIRKDFEPGAATVEERLEAIQEFKSIGCKVGVYMQPLLPGISDDIDGVTKLVEKLKDLKVDYITPWYVTLRPGIQKETYLKIIRNKYPDLIPLYSDVYRENRVSGASTKKYEKYFFDMVSSVMEGVNPFPPHYYYRGIMPIYCEVLILLEHMTQLYSAKGLNIDRLNKAYKKLLSYFQEEKKRFNRKRNLPADEIDERFLFLIKTGGLDSLIDNPKLSSFIYTVVIDRKLFSYQTLSLS